MQLRSSMREFCSCGSGITTISRRQVRYWRENHRHDAQEQPEPDKNGAEAITERRYSTEHGDPYEATARIGFTPNP
jgi:hypothetical protein